MKKVFLFAIFYFLAVTAFAQNTEESKVKQSIEQLFKGMINKDSVMIKAVMHKSARLNSASVDNE